MFTDAVSPDGVVPDEDMFRQAVDKAWADTKRRADIDGLVFIPIKTQAQ